MSFKKIFISILIIGVLAVIAAGVWVLQSNSYSKGSLKLEIIADDKAGLAEEMEYLVKYKNNGNTRLEDPKLIFQYPKHSLVEKERVEFELDDIYPGEERTRRFKARLLGTKGSAKVAKAWLKYRPKNLNANYESATTHTTLIKEVPLPFNFLGLPSMVKPGGEVKFDLNYSSNVDYPLSDLRTTIEYPSDFEFKKSKPQGLSETEWKIGMLNKAQGGRIEIQGKLNGKIGEVKRFKAKLGVWQDGEFVTLKESNRGVELGEPSLYITQQINGNPNYVASPGETLHYEISFKNIGEEVFSDMFLAVKLEGNGFDYNTIRAPNGSFKKGDNSVVFDSTQVSKLQFLDVGKEGTVEFWVDVKEKWNPEEEGKPSLTSRVLLDSARERFTTKVNSGLDLKQQAYYHNDMFHNIGPIPPEVGESTQYVVMWKPRTHFGQVKDVKIKSTLPENVELTGNIFPEDESSNFSFDSESREIVWDVGNLKSTSSPNVSFQVELTPKSSQRNSVVNIMESAKISGTDPSTEKDLTATSSPVDTTLPDDKKVSKEDGIIQ